MDNIQQVQNWNLDNSLTWENTFMELCHQGVHSIWTENNRIGTIYPNKKYWNKN